MTPAVSIIMPVYNTEKYLREALDSVLAQTMTDFEVLCVNDASTDSSLDILREYAVKDPRVIIIDSETNNGLAGARNLALPRARGKYLLFLDSDDLFDSQLVEKTYARAKETDADICIFGGEIFFDDTGERRPQPNFCRPDLCPETVFSAKDHPNEIFAVSTNSACNKLFRREFVNANGIVFPNTRTCEDVPYTMTALACANRVTLLNEVLFSYRQRSGSLMHTQDKYQGAIFSSLIELRERLTARGLYAPLKDAFAAMAAANCFMNLNTLVSGPGYKSTYAFIRDTAIPELGLDPQPDCAERLYPELRLQERVRDIREGSMPAFIAKYGPGLTTVIHFGDPILFLRAGMERLKRR